MSIFRKFADWLCSGEIPDCPSCNGTGEAGMNRISDYVHWKGQVHRVCFQCKGTGKV